MFNFSPTELTATQKTQRDLSNGLTGYVAIAEDAYNTTVTLIWNNQYGLTPSEAASILGADGVAVFALLETVKDALIALNSGAAITTSIGLVGAYAPSVSGDGSVVIL